MACTATSPGEVKSVYQRSIALDRLRRGPKPIHRLVLSMDQTESKYMTENSMPMLQYAQELRDILGESDSEVDSICSSVDEIERESDNETNENFVVDDDDPYNEHDTEYMPSSDSEYEEETDDASLYDSDDDEIVTGIACGPINEQEEQEPSSPQSIDSVMTHSLSPIAPPLSPVLSHALRGQMDDFGQGYHTA
jgi:hypothetical protein